MNTYVESIEMSHHAANILKTMQKPPKKFSEMIDQRNVDILGHCLASVDASFDARLCLYAFVIKKNGKVPAAWLVLSSACTLPLAGKRFPSDNLKSTAAELCGAMMPILDKIKTQKDVTEADVANMVWAYGMFTRAFENGFHSKFTNEYWAYGPGEEGPGWRI